MSGNPKDYRAVSSRQSNSRGGDGWPPPEREWWGDRGFVLTNVASGLLVVREMVLWVVGGTGTGVFSGRLGGGGPYRRYGKREVLAPRHSYMGEAFW